MGKRHIINTEKQFKGQYFTTKAAEMLSGLESIVKDKVVVDPFSGGWDLLNWAMDNGAKSVEAYDIDPVVDGTIYNDSLSNPVDCKDKVVITNPPYLSSIKSQGRYKDVYAKWGQNDLYKCYIASLVSSNVCQAVLIIPSNFLCESSTKARESLFANYDILSAKYWEEPVFEDATTGICLLHIKRRMGMNFGSYAFPCLFLPTNEEIIITMESPTYLHGGNELVEMSEPKIGIEKLIEQESNSNIIFSLLDGGKLECGFHYNENEPLRVKQSQITTFQVNLSVDLTEEQQRFVVKVANDRLLYLRKKYRSMFLSNYMGARQKIVSQKIAKNIVSRTIEWIMSK